MDGKIPWMVKEQTVLDNVTGATIRFGSYGAASHLIYLQLHIPSGRNATEGDAGRGVTIQFNRHTGECHGFVPHTLDDVAGAGFAAPQPAPEPYQPNPQARVIGSTPGAESALPDVAADFHQKTPLPDNEPNWPSRSPLLIDEPPPA